MNKTAFRGRFVSILIILLFAFIIVVGGFNIVLYVHGFIFAPKNNDYKFVCQNYVFGQNHYLSCR